MESLKIGDYIKVGFTMYLIIDESMDGLNWWVQTSQWFPGKYELIKK